MKILIISDTHRRDENYVRVMEREAPVDMIVHAGDAEGSEEYYEMVAGMPLIIVRGNQDPYSLQPGTRTFYMDRYRTLLTHGHRYEVHRRTDLLVSEAERQNCHIAIFGHTHVPGMEWVAQGAAGKWIPDQTRCETRRENWHQETVLSEGCLLMNPGSLGRPRQDGFRPSYIIVTTGQNGRFDARIRYL